MGIVRNAGDSNDEQLDFQSQQKAMLLPQAEPLTNYSPWFTSRITTGYDRTRVGGSQFRTAGDLKRPSGYRGIVLRLPVRWCPSRFRYPYGWSLNGRMNNPHQIQMILLIGMPLALKDFC